MNRKLSCWISGLALLAVGQRAQAQQSAAPADTTEIIHTVKPGDTLWDIASAYLQDPFRWPEIFRRNTDVVENPHWIYPGEQIRIRASAVRPDVLAARNQGAPVENVVPDDRTVFAQGGLVTGGGGGGALFGGVVGATAITRVSWGEIESAPYLDTLGGPRRAGRIESRMERTAVSHSATDVRFQLYDHAYVTLPANKAARLGDRYVSFKLGPEIGSGQVVIPTGVFVIDSLRSGYTRARLERQFGTIDISQGLISMDLVPRASEEELIPVATAATNKVVWVLNDPVLPSLQHYVVIDPGAVPPVSVGDVFTLVDARETQTGDKTLPPEDVGVIQIVRVSRHGATGIIVSQSQPVIRAGNLARRIARMP